MHQALFSKEGMTMKKIYVILAAAVAALMALSCEKNETELKESTSLEPRYFKCVLGTPESDSDTKINLDYSTGKTEWKVGDQILVHGAGSSNMKTVTLTAGDISADGKTATIDVTGITPYPRTDKNYDSELYASYPASLVPQSKNLYYNSAFVGDLNNEPLMAACDDASHDTFYFYHLTGVMTFTIDGDFDGYILMGAGGETVGYSTLGSRIAHMNDDSFYVRRVYDVDYYTCVPLTSISGSLVADGSTLNKIFFPGGATLSSGFTMYLTKGGDITHYVSTGKSVTIACGEVFPIGAIPAGKIHAYVPPSSHDATNPAIAGAEDLGATATANSYIVDSSVPANAGKVFKFKAVKGNSALPVGAVNSVEVLWETWNNAEAVTANSIIANVDYDKQDGDDDYWITLEMASPLHAGNAVIAAKNAGGDVVWSWHIWVPSTAITSSTYGGISTAPMMDRNLGALVIAEGDADTDIAVESCGMFYQWGRKDPFPGPKDLPNSYTSSATFSGTIGTRDATASTEINKYPNFFGQTGADTDGFKDWSTDHSSTLWGSSKNENDPCPPGWKLPIFASATGDLWDKDVTNKTGLAGYALNTTHHWLKLGVAYDALNPTTTGYVYFPLAGYRTQDNSDYANAGKRALIWQAYGESGDYAKCLYSDGSFVGYRTERKGRGGNVRCVAE